MQRYHAIQVTFIFLDLARRRELERTDSRRGLHCASAFGRPYCSCLHRWTCRRIAHRRCINTSKSASSTAGQPTGQQQQQQQLDPASHETPRIVRYRFQKEFAETCESLRTSTNAGLVIFIDDLDRCPPQQTMELLEAVNFIVSAGKCFVVLGMDKEQVKRAVLTAYKSVFIDLPEDAARPDIRSARVRFAERYLEKIINIEVPVPHPTPDQIAALLTGETTDATASEPVPRHVKLRRRLGLVYRNGPLLVLLGFVAGLAIVARRYLLALGVVAKTATQIGSGQSDTPSGAAAPPGLMFPEVFSSDTDLADVHSMAGFPWLSIALALLLLAAAGAYIARIWVDSLRHSVTDSQPFRDALKRWNRVILAVAETPRGVKQYKNLLRFQAMRGRVPSTNLPNDKAIPDQFLIAVGGIARADRSLLTEAQSRGATVRSIVQERRRGPTRSDSEILIALDDALGKDEIADPAGLGSVERFIPAYLRLLV
jgi:KAP family P-loop domain